MFKNRNLSILFFMLVVVMIGFGIIIPLLPFYVEAFGGSGIHMGLLMSIFSVMQFFFSPLWGSLSDRIGRKPVLIIGVLGNALTQLLFGLIGWAAAQGMMAPNVALYSLLTARGLAGVLSSATLPTAMAFISDSTDEQERGGGMGVVGAAMGIGMVLGPGIGGLLGGFSLALPFFFAAGLSVLAMLLVWWLLPESLPADARSPQNRLQGPQLAQMFTALAGPIGFLLVLAFLISFALTNFEGIYGYYVQVRYDYNARTIGYILTVIGIVSAIVQGGLTGPATRRFGDAQVVKASLLASVVGFLVMLLAKSPLMVYLTAGIFVSANAMIRPGVASLISKKAGMGQGVAMGLNNAYMSIGRVIGPLWAGVVIDTDINFPFLTGAVIMLIGFLASLFFLPQEQPLTAPATTD